MGKQLYDKQRQHIVHCQDDPLGELLEVDSFSVKNPRYSLSINKKRTIIVIGIIEKVCSNFSYCHLHSPVYEMLKKYLVVLGCAGK